MPTQEKPSTASQPPPTPKQESGYTRSTQPRSTFSEKLSEPQTTSEPEQRIQHQQKLAEPPAPRTEQEQLDAVSELFGDEPTRTQPRLEQPEDADELSDTLDSEAAEPSGTADLTPKGIADALGVPVEKLYEGLEITLQDGATVSLSELKDKAQTYSTDQHENVKRSVQLDERESAIMSQNQLLASIGTDLQSMVSPETLQRIQTNNAAIEREQQALMYKTMPELKDQASFASFRTDLVEALEPYGFQAHEVNITDHRILLAMKDYMKVKKQLKKLMAFNPDEYQEKTPPAQHRSQNKRKQVDHKANAIKRARGGSETDKINAVSSLLGG